MASRNAHFQVFGPFDMASRPSRGRLTIDRAAGIVTVRRSRARRAYSLPLDTVANMIVRRIIQAEVFQKRLEQAKKRKARKGR